MRINISTQGDAALLTIAGEFSGEGVPRFRQIVMQAVNDGRRDFLVDLSATHSLDSAALEALTALQRQTEEQLGMLRLCVTDPTLRKVFEITRLDQQIAIDVTKDEAMAGLASPFSSGAAASKGARP